MRINEEIEMLKLTIEVIGAPNSVCPVILSDKTDMILVDTGYPGQMSQIKDAFEKAGLEFKNINKIIITHQDLDHIGCLASIVNELEGKPEVMSHEIEKPYIQGDKKAIKMELMEARKETLSDQMKSIFEGMERGYKSSVSKVDTTLTDHEELPCCGGVKVIHTPGHTPGHISLYLKKYKILISGDTMFVENGKLILPQKFINHDSVMAEESIKKLSEYDIEKVICYHGGLYEDNPNEKIKELINLGK